MPHAIKDAQPLIGITCDVDDDKPHTRAWGYLTYAHAVARAGGVPFTLPPVPEAIAGHIDRLDGFVLSGGDDPRTEPFGTPTHPKATPVHPIRQRYETELLRSLRERSPDTPVLGICLGMQLMALDAGGTLDQHIPETTLTADLHFDAHHPIVPSEGLGIELLGPCDGTGSAVWSRHRQAVSEPGSMRTIACAPDGIIEAIAWTERRFCVGVQWHPERTDHHDLGGRVFDRFLGACAGLRV